MDQSYDKSIIEEKIKKIDEQITLLSTLRQNLIDKLNISESIKSPIKENTPIREFTPEEKINLFRRYFRGRDDVYARLWINDRTNRKGYSPACKNEWDRRLCRKPKVKCSECPNQEFYSIDDAVIRKHLTGGQVIGLYPMLKNEACYFLAIDLDKEKWLEDINALKTTCDEKNIPAVVERSRSGSGGHLWIFFAEEIPASVARMLGSHIITKTMGKRYQMNMKSYDRLFPNQDTLPKGGFGNLIALPFQKEAVRKGNSVFIDDKGRPYPDQWNFLASIRKLTFFEVRQIVDAAVNNNELINVQQSQIAESDEPWMRMPSGRPMIKVEINNLPKNIEAVFANRIYLKTDNVPSVILNQLKHLAAFQNPEFYKKQKMRFSTYDTPRVICCAEDEDGYLSLPRGCFYDVEKLLNKYSVKLKVQDQRYEGRECNFSFWGGLSDDQNKALKGILSSEIGVFVAPPGSGKTIIAIAAIAERKRSVLILVHRKPIMDQWRLQISSLLGIDKKEVGQIGGGKSKSNGIIDVAMVQSLDKGDGVDDRIADYGFVIVDECHHVSAFTFEKVLSQAKAKYVLGLTSTPYRRDGHQPIIHMQCGPVCYQIKQKELPSHLSGSTVITRDTNFTCEWNDNSKIQDVLLKLVGDEQRNQMIAEDIVQVVSEGRFPLILTERREHLEKLAGLLKNKVEFVAFLYGGLRKKAALEIVKQLKESPDNTRKVILATGSYIGEGFDEPRLDTLFLTMPSSFKGKIVQYAGRLNRYHKDKKEVRIFDYVDKNVPVLEKMFQKRMKTYKMLGYTINLEKKLS